MKIKNKAIIVKYIKYLSIIVMSIFYINVGIKHFVDPNWFLHIIPPFLEPIGLELVYISGFFEILFGLMLIIPKTRQLASYGLILLLIAVYPANLYLAFYEKPQQLIGISAFAASWIRLPIQFIFLGLAYWHSKD
tara:strand:- start:1799 stop:2203 length:405 start_codon:yes stop_codon:yes gene_type:complete